MKARQSPDCMCPTSTHQQLIDMPEPIPATDILFTPQQKFYLMTLLGIKDTQFICGEPGNNTETNTPATTQTCVQDIMNDIRTPAHTRNSSWNYIASSPLSKTTSKPISEKFNTLCFKQYNGTTDLDKHLQRFLALMMIHNVFDIELCCLSPSSLRDTTLCWLASLPPRFISSF